MNLPTFKIYTASDDDPVPAHMAAQANMPAEYTGEMWEKLVSNAGFPTLPKSGAKITYLESEWHGDQRQLELPANDN